MTSPIYIDQFYKYNDGKLVYQHNDCIYCNKCNRLRYMGYAYPADGLLANVKARIKYQCT